MSKHPDDSDVDVIGTFAGTFPKDDIMSFVGEDNEIKLGPIFRDIKGERQLSSFSKFGKEPMVIARLGNTTVRRPMIDKYVEKIGLVIP